MNKFDIIIPTGIKDVSFVPRVVDFVYRCFEEMEHIYILTSKKNFVRIKRKIPIYVPCTLIDENKLLPGLSYSVVADILMKYCPNKRLNIGWYFQQFLKLGFAQSKYCKDYYVSWDADTLPLAPITFFEEGYLLFNPKSEYNSNYFRTIERLFGYGKQTEYSFIAENMIFSKNIVDEMLAKIEKSDVDGTTWMEKILVASDLNNSMPAFSEFETYGTYCSVNYPGLYKPRYLNTFREAGYICGRNISEDRLRIMSFDLDTVSFEMRHAPMFPYNLPNLIFNSQERFNMIKSLTSRQIIKKVWNKLLCRQDTEKQAAIEQFYRLPQRNTTKQS